MKLPKTIAVGDKKYTIINTTTKEPYVLGSISYTNCTITVSTKTPQRVVPKAEQAVVFWHEVVHAILHDINKPKLNKDEKFVEEFAERLHQVTTSARF